ncbi:MAG: 50S ribosomal protein L30 [Thermoleophilaceae bacterium]
MTKLTITQIKSINGANPKQRATLKSLGLGKIGRTTERDENDVVRGMIAKVSHLVKVDG